MPDNTPEKSIHFGVEVLWNGFVQANYGINEKALVLATENGAMVEGAIITTVVAISDTDYSPTLIEFATLQNAKR